MNILTLLGFDMNDFIVEPLIEESEYEITIHATLKDNKERMCPICKSKIIYSKGLRETTIKHQCSNIINKEIFVVLKKHRYKCLTCGSTFAQTTNFIDNRRTISNEIRWSIFADLKEFVSFSYVARRYKISISIVRKIFLEMIRIGRDRMPECLTIDEKKFHSDEGKYACILGNAKTSSIVDVIASRQKDYLFNYFSKLSLLERNQVKFFSSDMYEGYRTIKRKFFPNAIHIIDHFHISKLFTETLQFIRKDYMNNYPKNTKEYNFIKKNWKLFLINPYSKKASELRFIDKNNGVLYTLNEKIRVTIASHKYFLEIYDLYSDYCEYMDSTYTDKELKISLDFIINKAINSTNKYINKLGNTLLNFYDEILNFFTTTNIHKISNGSAESLNNNIQQIINISRGIRSFTTFRFRLLYSLKKKG